jgi:hypothetical protein
VGTSRLPAADCFLIFPKRPDASLFHHAWRVAKSPHPIAIVMSLISGYRRERFTERNRVWTGIGMVLVGLDHSCGSDFASRMAWFF